jgi:hypothetical protein
MPMHIETPLIESRPLSVRLNKSVRLKMDALQPSSFKTADYTLVKPTSGWARGP